MKISKYFIQHSCRRKDVDGWEETWTQDMCGDYIEATNPTEAIKEYYEYLVEFYSTEDRTVEEVVNNDRVGTIMVRFWDGEELYIDNFKAEVVERE